LPPALSDGGSGALALDAGLSLSQDAFRGLQETVDCWLAVAGSAGGSGGERGGAWVNASTGAGGWLYPAGTYLGAHAFGRDDFRWVPDERCGARWRAGSAWEPAAASRVLDRFGGLFFVGDSIMSQLFYSVVSAFPGAVPVMRHPPDPPAVLPQASSALLPPANAAVMFMRNDDLSWGTREFGYAMETTNLFTEVWAPEVAAGPWRTLVLSRGAHVALTEPLLAELNATLAAVRAARPDVLLVWLAALPGAHLCSLRAGMPPLDSIAHALGQRENWPYEWALGYNQAEAVRRLLAEHHPHVLVVDARDATLMRPETRVSAAEDAHGAPPEDIDCLHFAMPGPLDLTTYALVEALALLESTARAADAAPSTSA
jgi:hypothetical protein